MTGVLDGVRVVDFSRVFAGPAATQVLGDLGAEVIKVEAPGIGDEARFLGLTEGTAPRLGASASFLALNRNKESIVLDLRQPAGREVARRLILASDVVVHNFRTGAMAKWQLDYADLQGEQPGLIYCAFSAYGATGPLAHIGANDLALQAHSGLMSMTGEPGRPPVRVGTSAIDLHGAMCMVSAILAALLHRERSGKGQLIETSLLLSSAHLMNYFYSEFWVDGVSRKAMGTANHLSVPNQVFPSKDGSVVIIAPSDAMWQRCARALDPERLDRPEYRSITDRQRCREAVIEAITAATTRRTSDELVELLGAAKVNVAKVNSVGEAASHPQLEAARGTIGFSFGGEVVKAVTSPFHLSETPVEVRLPPPRLGEHKERVLGALGYDDDEVAALEAAGAFGPVDATAGGEDG